MQGLRVFITPRWHRKQGLIEAECAFLSKEAITLDFTDTYGKFIQRSYAPGETITVVTKRRGYPEILYWPLVKKFGKGTREVSFTVSVL